MDQVANLPAKQRAELFRETGSRRGIGSAVAEKDFWVCWVLKRLFADPALKEHLVFKGGTTLSKVFGIIERFSEDVDLILDWRLLGFGEGLENPYQEFGSNTKQDQFNKRFNEKAAEYIAGELLPRLCSIFAVCPQVTAAIDTRDAQTIDVAYPAAFSETYLRPNVRLEIGPLASWIPSAPHMIRPYAADLFPELFADPACPVVAVAAERTFWEKATILHQQAHRTGVMPPRYSRHYYDVHRLAQSPVKDAALHAVDLLRDVVEFKQRFYPCGWANYEQARPGTFKLMPSAPHRRDLEKDYDAMRMMIFGEVPQFTRIIEALAALEEEINHK
jgi:Nucleotidyl transferase AbiEii toxin, Type IV TA system